MLTPEDRENQARVWEACRAGAAPTVRLESHRLRTDGLLVAVHIQGMVSERDSQGLPTRMVGTITDISEEERAGRLMLDTHLAAKIGGYELNLVTGRILWTPGLYKLLGLTEVFALSPQSTRELVRASSRARVLKFINNALETGESFDLEFECAHAKGHSLWVRMTGKSEFFAGKVLRVYGTVQDISDRRALEQELLSTANKEQQRLGQELHDGLGQQLTGIAMTFEGLSQKLKEAQPELALRIDQANEGLQAAVHSTRVMAHGMAPVSLQRGGLAHALKLLAAEISQTGQCVVRYHEGLMVALNLDDVASGHLYRIAQEAISNAIRHGQAGEIDVELRSAPGRVRLRIDDNGKGMPKPAPAHGLGMRSMNYRAKALNGTFLVSHAPAGGVRVEVDCPQALPED